MSNVDYLSFLNNISSEKPLNELDSIAQQTRQQQIKEQDEENRKNPRHWLPSEMVCKVCENATVLVEDGDSATGENQSVVIVHCGKLHGLVMGGEYNRGPITACSSLKKIDLPPLKD